MAIAPLGLSGADLLTGFAVTLARYLDSPTVSLARGDRSRWVPLTVTMDLDAPWPAARAQVEQATEDPATAPQPTFGVSDVATRGASPALMALVDAPAGAYVEYAADAYAETHVRRFVEHLRTLTAARASTATIGRLPLVSPGERDLLAPHRRIRVPDPSLVDLVADQVERHPSVTAVRAGGRSLTYAELWQRSGATAARLPSSTRIGVWGERDVDLLVGLLGVLRAGSAYVALEPGYPAHRLRTVARLAGLGCVVAGPGAATRAATALDLAVEPTQDRTPGNDQGPAATALPAPDDLAYVMFTSGSTGEPKGVMVEHRQVVNTLRHLQHDPGLRPGEVMLGVTTSAFDLSVPDLFLPLVSGATLVLADSDDARDGTVLARVIAAHRPNLMQATPSTWRLLCESGWAGDPTLRVVCGGEAYDAALARDLIARTAGVWNCYGPTETTVWSLSTRLRADDADPLPLGRPMRGVDCFLLDSHGEPVPPGVRGEIALAGAGVARGYLGREDLTASAFVPCRFPDAVGDRMYLTGDLGRVAADGSLRFAGRRDHQVKINGFRVELGEIEAALGAQAGVSHAVAVVREMSGRPRIVGYVVTDDRHQEEDAAAVPAALRTRLADLLPPQCVPAEVVVLDRLPLTANGKVDRAALPEPDERVGRVLNGELERLVATVCTGVLGVPVRYADDDVLAIGADSLAVGRIASHLTADLGVDVSPTLLFRHPSVAGLATALLAVLLGDETDLLDRYDVARGPAT